MVQNKKKIKVSVPMFDKLEKENSRRQKRKPIFKMSKKTKTKIKVLLATAAIVVGGVETARNVYATSNNNKFDTEKTFVIGIANDNAEIKDDGQRYKIDSNSFVIVSETDALAYDENGNIQKGQVSGDIEQVFTMTEDEMSKYNIYQVISKEGVNVREEGTIEDNNIISTVAYQDYVLGYPENKDENDVKWISTLSVNGDNIYKGYIREDLIQEVGKFNLIYENANEILMKVDTSKDGNVNLNLRTQPEDFDKRAIMTTIPNGSIVRKIDQTISENSREWSYIEYETQDGYKLKGWVASEYLTSYFNQERAEKVEENAINIKTNETGNVTGIDISSISPNALRELLQNGIPENVATNYGSIDTSRFAGNINFAYIKLGASPYGKGDFEPVEYDSYKEQVKVCEQMGVPYGFYYYSTSTTIEEANIELENITHKIKDLREEVDMKNNKLEIVVDIELSGKNDRQYQGDIEEQTRAKATLINGIQEAGLSNNVLIYGPMRVMRPDLDQIISLSDLHSMLSNPNNVDLWLCTPANPDGQISSNFENEKAYGKQQGFDTVVSQVVLDGNVVGKIDINNMNLEHYQSLMQQTNEIIQNQNISNEIDER
ncbi:MAG: hypothetical protein IJE68_02845 [Clostridia bacterium]|nr:hypothetical protein [Clostridia bacterium]